MESLVMTKATLDEAEMIMDVVNTAYKVEFGSEGLAFKRADRWVPKLHNCDQTKNPTVIDVGIVFACLHIYECIYSKNSVPIL